MSKNQEVMENGGAVPARRSWIVLVWAAGDNNLEDAAVGDRGIRQRGASPRELASVVEQLEMLKNAALKLVRIPLNARLAGALERIRETLTG